MSRLFYTVPLAMAFASLAQDAFACTAGPDRTDSPKISRPARQPPPIKKAGLSIPVIKAPVIRLQFNGLNFPRLDHLRELSQLRLEPLPQFGPGLAPLGGLTLPDFRIGNPSSRDPGEPNPHHSAN
jgi:hypothetical protein